MTGGYTVVQDWMLDLGLDLTSTFAFAVIYGFSQDGESIYQGTHQWLADKCRCSRDTIKRCLVKLVSGGFVQKIDREINGVKFCSYKAIVDCDTLAQNAPTPGANCTTLKIIKNNIKEISTIVDTKKETTATPESPTSTPPEKEKEKGCAEKEKGKGGFDFFGSLVELGVSTQTVSDWLLIRSKKRAVNTYTAFKAIKKQVELAKGSGISAEQCIRMAATKSWAGFEYQWYVNEMTRNGNGKDRPIDRRRGTDVMDVPIEEYYKPF